MAKRNQKEYLSTGQAAGLCSVTPDTVLKWIKSGRIAANRTPGGHYRINRATLESMIESDRESVGDSSISKRFNFCWEFYSKSGRLLDGCRDCLVYRSRAGRCYEVSRLPSEAGHAKLFCEGTCEDCEYYRVVQGQRPNVLVVTDKPELEGALKVDPVEVDFNLRFCDSEYRCSMVIEKFRPDYVVIDCSLGRKRCRDFTRSLEQDPRIPYVRIVLAGEPKQIPKECNRSVFAFFKPPFSMEHLTDLINGLRSNRQAV